MGNIVNARDMELIQAQTKGFLNAETLPISYIVEETKYRGIPAEFHPVCEIQEHNSTVKEYVFIGRNEELGLEIRTIVTEYADYPVYDIVAWFTAHGTKRTPMLREIKVFDGLFHGEKAVLYTNSGDFCSENSYEQTRQPYTHEMWTRITPQGGRSCDQAFPYFKVQFEDSGLNLAVGWPGQWAADFGVVDHGIGFATGQNYQFIFKPEKASELQRSR